MVSAANLNLVPEQLTKISNPGTWLTKFNLIAAVNEWNDERQAVIIPTFLCDKYLEDYEKSDFFIDPPNTKKLEKIKRLILKDTRSEEHRTSLFQKF